MTPLLKLNMSPYILNPGRSSRLQRLQARCTGSASRLPRNCNCVIFAPRHQGQVVTFIRAAKQPPAGCHTLLPRWPGAREPCVSRVYSGQRRCACAERGPRTVAASTSQGQGEGSSCSGGKTSLCESKPLQRVTTASVRVGVITGKICEDLKQ